MNRYGVNKVMYDVYRDNDNATAFTSDPSAYLAPYDLTDEESKALTNRDVRRLVEGGAHPFLVFNFALCLAGGFSIEFCLEYVNNLRGLDVGDITT
ncbi:hypothetical protein [Streptomyces himalayensis]|uniref:Extradiol ring-cleavage dioxygenase LigAB LigA subunit domain-containing protein n=1 Tax=Streptomyces himalayensis subsp. himalayensis TaxID=2756131 RepID=A0A7W0DM37_9ACTN|nr:hypothetical protein [Streptomyces himalayensis]MBA2946839.1 hypothetical protein [Streptomyces himalayensis subsp. himalayensis]